MINDASGDGIDWHWLLSSPVWLAMVVFQIWMLVHAVRNREWVWAVFILIGWTLTSVLYFFSVYRGSASSGAGFELPGAQSRQRIKELKAQIHHLDNAYHHFQLGDVYFQRGKYAEAEKCYRAALEREPKDIDTRAHLGQCLLRLKRPAEAKPLLEGVCRENYKHDFGHSLMAYAETLTALQETDAAYEAWKHVVANHSYARAKVQFAEVCIARKENDLARTQLRDVVNDDAHAPSFQRSKDRVWVRRAKHLLQLVP